MMSFDGHCFNFRMAGVVGFVLKFFNPTTGGVRKRADTLTPGVRAVESLGLERFQSFRVSEHCFQFLYILL